MTQYAAYDANGYVLGFIDADQAPPNTSSRSYRATASPVSGWPTPPAAAARLKIDPSTGVLSWNDPRTEAEAWADVRAERERRFVPGDRVALKAFSQGAQMPTTWASHQQALRDITEQSDPFNITWPTPPQE